MKTRVWTTIGVLAMLTGACAADSSDTAATSTSARAATTDTTVAATGGGLEAVRAATIQITAEGSFVDPDVGAQSFAGSGSGFIVDPSGIAVTNNHVVTGAGLLEVHLADGTTHSAKVLGVSECNDLAVIDIEGDGFTSLDWYSGAVTPGLEIYAAGFPLGDPEYTLTKGIVSKASANGEMPWTSVTGAIEHDANIQQGNSGGPLVTAEGLVVGVNYAGFTPLGGSTTQFFAIGAPEARPVVDKLTDGNDVESLGINGTAVVTEASSGIWVSGVTSGSPADNAGIQGGDIILEVEGITMGEQGTMTSYCKVLRSHEETDTMSVRVLRSATEEVLAGQFNGTPLEAVFSFAQEADAGVAQGDAYADYDEVIDDSGVLAVSVPTVWADRRTAPLTLDDGSQLPAIQASTDIAALETSFDVPGLIFIATEAAPGADLDGLLDSRGEDVFASACTNGGRFDYSDAQFTGRYDIWTDCAGTTSDYFVVASQTAEGTIALVEVQVVTDADLAALDRALATFRKIG